MNFTKKSMLYISLLFSFSTIIGLINLVLSFANIIEKDDGVKILLIIISSYSLIASLVFLIIFLKKKSYRLYVTDYTRVKRFLMPVSDFAIVLIAWLILTILISFAPEIGFVIFIMSLMLVILKDTLLIIINNNKVEIVFIFDNNRITVMKYYKFHSETLLRKDITINEIEFNDTTLEIKLVNGEYSLKIPDLKSYMKYKDTINSLIK